MSTLADLRTRLKEVFIRTDKDTEINRAISDAYLEMIAVIGDHKVEDRYYETIVAGRSDYLLPTSFLRIRHPAKIIDAENDSSHVSSYPLRFLPPQEFDQWEPNPDATAPTTGRPWAYTIKKNSYLLTSVPDKAYTIEFLVGGSGNALVDDADEPVFASHWDETIVAGALKRMYALVKLYDQSNFWGGVYVNGHVDPNLGMSGGLNLLKQLNSDNTRGPAICQVNAL